jgi:hypothetical protein
MVHRRIRNRLLKQPGRNISLRYKLNSCILIWVLFSENEGPFINKKKCEKNMLFPGGAQNQD